jgi:hypothetical protein
VKATNQKKKLTLMDGSFGVTTTPFGKRVENK